MAYDEGLAELIRDEIGERDGLSERAMFGGLGFMLDGNMVCAVRSGGGAFFRVGRDSELAAMELAGVKPMVMAGRRMGGFVAADKDALADDAIRAELTSMALATAADLPSKQ